MKRKKSVGRQLKPKTENQAKYIRAMVEADVTICTGPAGTGKTTIAVGLACQYLVENKVSKIIVTRPVVESGKGLGFLPGTFQDKIHPYLVPIFEEMNLYLSKDAVEKLLKENLIEICPLEYMRGRNFHNSFIILDEAQNATYQQIKMLITRMGSRSKCVINGDIEQTDLPHSISGALEECVDRLDNLKGVSIVELERCDIIRNKIISSILERLEDD
jgi:phosphate starvation-inducible PhoH-like protein